MGMCELDSSGLDLGSVVESCVCDTEPLGFTEGRQCLD